MKLTSTQARVLQLVANAELRTKSQTLSLLLAEGLRFYFIDREPAFSGVELDCDEAVRQLLNDAAELVQIQGITE